MSFSTRLCAALAMTALVLSVAAGRPLSEEARLLRYPSIMGDKVAFVYAGDIWTVPASGGTARRITSFAEGF
jgi:tricorn protease